jgi:hypothetical protein
LRTQRRAWRPGGRRLPARCPRAAPWRPAVGIAPKLTDAELLTLAVLQALLGYVSEARWLRYARTHLRGLFPYLPRQSGYNKRLRAAFGLLRYFVRALAIDTDLWNDTVWVAERKTHCFFTVSVGAAPLPRTLLSLMGRRGSGSVAARFTTDPKAGR